MTSEMMILVRAAIIHTLIGVEATVRPMMRTAIPAVIRATNAAIDAEMSKLATKVDSAAAMCLKSIVAAMTTQTMMTVITDEERNHPREGTKKAEVALDKTGNKRLVSLTKSKTCPSSSRMSSLKSSKKFASGGETYASGSNIQTFNTESKELFSE